MNVVLTRAALRELEHEVGWYERRVEGLGAELAAAFEAKLQRIAQTPGLYRTAPEDARVRRARLHRFPFWIVFHATDVAIVVIAFAHEKRRPNYWAKRLKRQLPP